MPDIKPDVVANQVYMGDVRRNLPAITYVSNQTVSGDLPRDSVFKRISFRLVGSFTVTYTGSPIASPLSAFDRLVNRIDVVANGERVIKSVTGQHMRMLNMLSREALNERAYSSSASPFTTALAQTEAMYGAQFVYPATTQNVLVNETIEIPFEYPFDSFADQKMATWYDTRGLSSSDIRYSFGDVSGFQREETSQVAVTYTNTAFTIQPVTTEAPGALPRGQKTLDYKQTVRRTQVSGQVRDLLIDLPRGNRIAGIHLLVRNGDVNRTLSDFVLTDIGLIVNGQRLLARFGSFLNMQNAARTRYGLQVGSRSTASAGVTCPQQGYAYIGLAQNGMLETALDASVQAGVDNLQLTVSTGANSGTDAVTYTNPVEISLMVDELVVVP